MNATVETPNNEIMFDREGLAHIAFLFETFRPWQVFELIRRHWKSEIDAMKRKEPRPLIAEAEEALTAHDECHRLSVALKEIDDREAEEFEQDEANGVYDEINRFLTEEAKNRPIPTRLRRFHRYPKGEYADGKCVYCGAVEVHTDPKEECGVLLIAAATFARSALASATGEK